MHCRTEQYLVTDASLHIHPRRGGVAAMIDDGGKQTKRWWFPMKRGICPTQHDDPVSMGGQGKRQRVPPCYNAGPTRSPTIVISYSIEASSATCLIER